MNSLASQLSMRRKPENGDKMHNNTAYGSQGRGGTRSYGSGGGYYSVPTDRIRETNHNIMEMQNNAHIDDLSDQVRTLRTQNTDKSTTLQRIASSATYTDSLPSKRLLFRHIDVFVMRASSKVCSTENLGLAALDTGSSGKKRD